MIKAYRIGIEIAATNSVAPVLRVITRDLLGMGREADHLKGKFTAVKLAAVGAFAAMGGIAILGATAKLASYGNKLAEVQSRLRQMGVSAGNVGKLTNSAFTQSMRTPNVDYADALAALMKTRTVLGSSKEASAAAPYVVRTEGVLTNWGMGGPTALAELLKSIELRGGTYGPDGKTFSVAALRTNLTDALAAQNIAGKLLTPNVIMRTTKLAGPASQMMGGWAWWSSMAEAAQQMGPSAGRGFAMALKEFSGGPISMMYASSLVRYGLVKPDGLFHPSINGHPDVFQSALKPNALKGSDVLYEQGLFPWVQKVLVPTLEAHGVHGKKALLAAVYQTISSQTGSRLVANMITNALSYIRTSKQMKQSMGVSVYGTQMSQSMSGPMKAFHGAFESFLMTIGRPLVPVAVKVLNTLTNAIVGMTKWAKVHPETIRRIVYGVGILGTALVGFGTGAVIAALAMLGWVPAVIAGATAAVATGITLVIANFNGMRQSLLMAGTAIERFIHKVAFIATHPLADLRAAGSFLTKHVIYPLEGPAQRGVFAGGTQGVGKPVAPYQRQAAVPALHPFGADNGLIPTVNIGNWGDGQRAIKHGLAASLNQNQASTTGFNGRASAFGTPAFTGP